MHLHFLIILLHLLSWTGAHPKYDQLTRDTTVYACGEHIDKMIDFVCNRVNGQGIRFRRALTEEFLGYDYDEDGGNDRRYKYSDFSREVPNTNAAIESRSKKQVSDHCCHQPCTLGYLAEYCSK